MLKPKTCATGVSGKTGSIVVAELLQAGYPVRALVHHEEGRSAGRKGRGAEIAVAVAAPMGRAPRYAAACRTRGAMHAARLGSHNQSREFEPKE
jgi:uncharacterized protein YbjT (DUF2867 family)